jgi:hypothetical protein
VERLQAASLYGKANVNRSASLSKMSAAIKEVRMKDVC